MICQNCSHTFATDDQFCPNCGQNKKDLNRPFRQLISESLYELFDIDGRLSSTLYTLLFKPGHLSSSYRAGKRVSFTPPLRMYLITSLLLFFIMSLIKTDYSDGLEKISFLLLPYGVLEQIPKIMVVLLPIYALFLQISQPRSKYIFNLVFAVHIHTFWYLLFLLFLLLQLLNNYIPALSDVGFLIVGYFAVYQLVAIKHFFMSSWLKSFIINLFTMSIYLGAMSLGLEIVIELQEAF